MSSRFAAMAPRAVAVVFVALVAACVDAPTSPSLTPTRQLSITPLMAVPGDVVTWNFEGTIGPCEDCYGDIGTTVHGSITFDPALLTLATEADYAHEEWGYFKDGQSVWFGPGLSFQVFGEGWQLEGTGSDGRTSFHQFVRVADYEYDRFQFYLEAVGSGATLELNVEGPDFWDFAGGPLALPSTPPSLTDILYDRSKEVVITRELGDPSMDQQEVILTRLWIPGTVEEPETKADCLKGKWETYHFKNQGQCIRFVETTKDSR